MSTATSLLRVGEPTGPTLTINYETFGHPDDPALLLVNGLGSQLLGWPDEFCEGLVDRGFFVVRFDNRDVGLSARVPDGERYRLLDMAGDAVAVLDDLGIDRAHVAGMSMGGMIVQTLAIEFAERISTFTSIMSTTGDRTVGKPTAEALAALLTPPPDNIEAAVEQDVAFRKIWASPEWYDEDDVRAHFREHWARAADNRADRQYMAVMADGDRTERLRSVQVPALVIHGSEDTLIDPSGGRHTAEVLPVADYLEIEGMGHDIPPQTWQPIIHAITALAAAHAS